MWILGRCGRVCEAEEFIAMEFLELDSSSCGRTQVSGCRRLRLTALPKGHETSESLPLLIDADHWHLCIIDI
jgi:hypothetical protein